MSALSNIWEILSGGVKKPASEWGVSEISRTRHNQGRDVVTMSLAGLDLDADPPFANEALITILRDGVPWFHGLRTKGAAVGTPRGEDGDLVFQGPWWWLENIVFQQDFAAWWAGETLLVKNSDVTMNLTVDAIGQTTKIGTRQQIILILQWAIACGAPLLIDEADIPDADIPIGNERDVTCAQAILHQLRWTPNAAAWFDYSTTPPTLRIKPREKLATASLSVKPSVDDADMESFQIEPRFDLQVPEVVLKWKRVNNQNGTAFTSLYQDVFPAPAPGAVPGARAKALVSTIDLRGSVSSQAVADIETAEIFADASAPQIKLDWWKAKLPHLADKIVKDLTIEEVTRETARQYELFGQSAQWMGGTTGEETITCLVSYQLREKTDSETIVKIVKRERVSIRLTTTTLRSGSFTQGGFVDYGEPQPVGLAEWLWKQTNPLVFDGGVSLVEKECDSAIGVGHVLNVLDGRPEWAGMRAVVQQVSEVLSVGRTTLILGPPKHLGIDDIVEHLRASRATRRTSTADDISSGRQLAGRGIQLGDKTRVQDTLQSHGFMTRLVMKDPTDPDGPSITLDLEDLKDPFNTVTYKAKFEEIFVCVVDADGKEHRRKRKFLCTNEFVPAVRVET